MNPIIELAWTVTVTVWLVTLSRRIARLERNRSDPR